MLMGVSAARLHNVVPCALGIAIVAVPGDRRDIVLRDRDGLVHFVERDTDVLDAELMTIDLGQCLVTRAARGLNQLPSSSTGVGETVPPSTGERRGLVAAYGGPHDGCRAGTGLAQRSLGTP